MMFKYFRLGRAATLLAATVLTPGCGQTDPGNTSPTNSESTSSLALGRLSEWTARDVAAEGVHTCVVHPDGVSCWGTGFHGQIVSVPGTFTSVLTGNVATCGFELQGQRTCWGDIAGSDQLPVPLPRNISMGQSHACGIKAGNEVVCWSEAGARSSWLAPPAGSYLAVDAGHAANCAIDFSGAVQCWGQDEGILSPPAEGDFSIIDVGATVACASGSQTTCWGTTSLVQDEFYPDLAVGHGWACGIDTDDSLHCWDLGRAAPTGVPQGTFRKVVAGSDHACAISTDARLVCWGSNVHGQAGIPANVD